jgi:hypothetical protein
MLASVVPRKAPHRGDCGRAGELLSAAWPVGLGILAVTTLAAFVDGLADLYGRRRVRE